MKNKHWKCIIFTGPGRKGQKLWVRTKKFGIFLETSTLESALVICLLVFLIKKLQCVNNHYLHIFLRAFGNVRWSFQMALEPLCSLFPCLVHWKIAIWFTKPHNFVQREFNILFTSYKIRWPKFYSPSPPKFKKKLEV